MDKNTNVTPNEEEKDLPVGETTPETNTEAPATAASTENTNTESATTEGAAPVENQDEVVG